MTKKEFVSMSLPYGLKVLIPESDTKGCRKTVIGTVGAVFDDGSVNCFDTVNACPKWYKPILYPMSDLSSVIKYKGKKFIPICRIYNMSGQYAIGESWFRNHNISCLPSFIMNEMIEWHFDIAGLIEKGQAVDVNTLKVNPYKKK